jgi:hypothetical protein
MFVLVFTLCLFFVHRQQQQQKSRQDEKRRQQQAKAFPYSSPAQHPSTNQQPELSRFGNQPVVTTESTKPSKPEDKKSVKTQEIARAEIARAEPPVKSSVCILT